MLTVAGLMTRDVVTVNMDASIHEVQRVFAAAPFHHLVVTEEKRVVGVISDRDLLKHLSPFIGNLSERSQDRSLLNRRVHQIMTRALLTVRPEQDAGDAGRMMLEHRVSCLPVVDEHGACAGILTLRDIARWAVELLNEHRARYEAA